MTLELGKKTSELGKKISARFNAFANGFIDGKEENRHAVAAACGSVGFAVTLAAASPVVGALGLAFAVAGLSVGFARGSFRKKAPAPVLNA